MQPSLNDAPVGRLEVLKLREFRFFLATRMCLTLAMQIQALVVGWQIYQLTHDPLDLGLIGLAEVVPSIGVSLYAGHVADLVSRRRIILLCLLTLLVSTIGLWILSWPMAQPLLQSTTFPIYAIIFVTGLGRGFIGPAIFGFLTQVVEKRQLTTAVNWASTNWQVSSVLGLTAGGFLLDWLGLSATYLIQVMLLGLGMGMCLLIAAKPNPEIVGEYHLKERLTAGIKFIFNNQIILSAISLDLFAVLFGGAEALLPIFQKEILQVDESGLGILRAAPAVGAICMAAWLAYRPIAKDAGRKLLLSVVAFGFSMILFGASQWFWLSVFALFLSGIFDYVSVIIRSTLLQTHTPENMKGRVSSVNNIFVGSSNEIGAFESGVMARLMGTAISVIFGGCMTIVVVIITAWKAKSLRKLDL
ncbi:MAG: MFS transporter [Chitinophagales bacterium]|nr:MFS transporter [Chitinophagales bacterium]